MNERKLAFWKVIIPVFLVPLLIMVGLFCGIDGGLYLQNGDFEEKTELFGEFSRSDDTIYASVPSNGDYPIPQADLNSFHALSDDWKDGHIALDKNHVYCGNLIVPGMDPATTKALGNSYYSDGNTTYYCARISDINPDLAWWQEVPQLIFHDIFGGPKPQNYIYKMNKLPASDKPYYTILDHSIITNGELVYYQGKLMPQANPNSLRFITKSQYGVIDQNIQSDIYLADGKNVYYHNKLLPLADNEAIYSIDESHFFGNHYLIDPSTGMCYINDTTFAIENAPYQLISSYDSHIYHDLLQGKDGIYYYEREAKTILRAGDNPFSDDNYEEIAPLVFYNGKETLYIDAYQKWIETDTRHRDVYLDSYYTAINRLDGLSTKANWQKLGTVDEGSIEGSIWQHGNQIYYFDNYGDSEIFSEIAYDVAMYNNYDNLVAADQLSSTIYIVKDRATVDLLLDEDLLLNGELISQLIADNKLVVPPHSEILQAKTQYQHDFLVFRRWLAIIGIGVLAIMLIVTFILVIRAKLSSRYRHLPRIER